MLLGHGHGQRGKRLTVSPKYAPIVLREGIRYISAIRFLRYMGFVTDRGIKENFIAIRMMASMSPQLLRPHLLVLLLVLVLAGPAACNVDCDPSDAEVSVSNYRQFSAMGTASRGIKAALIHRDHHSLRHSSLTANSRRRSPSSPASPSPPTTPSPPTPPDSIPAVTGSPAPGPAITPSANSPAPGPAITPSATSPASTTSIAANRRRRSPSSPTTPSTPTTPVSVPSVTGSPVPGPAITPSATSPAPGPAITPSATSPASTPSATSSASTTSVAADRRRQSPSTTTGSPASTPSATSPASQDENWDPTLTLGATHHEYLMNISLGTPPQTFIVLADTGSDLNWVQCLPLENVYNDTDGAFDPSKSSTFAQLSCASSPCKFLSQFHSAPCESGQKCPSWCDYSPSADAGRDCFFYYEYGTGATNGTLAEDTIHIGTVERGVESVPKFSFGCAHNATDQGEADGLFGLGRGDISFPSQLGQYFGRVFSYCLVDSDHRETETSLLTFGDDALSPTAANGSRLQLQFTPLLDGPSSTFYYVDLEGISVNGEDIPIPRDAFAINGSTGSGGTIFDSGSSVSSLVSKAFDPFVEALQGAITQYEPFSVGDSLELSYSELCYNASWDTWVSEYGKEIPTVSFNFANNVTLDLGVRNVWDNNFAIELEGIICLAIERDLSSTIIGNWQQTDHYVVYDLEKQRLGLAPADCLTLKDHS